MTKHKLSEYDARAQTVSAHKVPIELSSKPIAHIKFQFNHHPNRRDMKYL